MAETIADYLVSLGFKVDKAQEARFKDTLASAAKTAAGIAAAMTAAATAISASVVKIASDFDALYFAAQRSNASVSSIKSLSYALSQVGGSSGQALSAIESVATALRTNPGTENFLKSLGVATRENGRLRETGAVIHDIVEALKTKPYYVSAQIAGIMGIDEKTWQITVSNWGKIEEFQAEYNRQAKAMGVDPDRAAESSNKLMTSFRALMQTIGLVFDKITIELQPALSKYLEELGKWFQDHADDIQKALTAIVGAVVGMIADFANLAKRLAPVAENFIAITKSILGENGLKYAMEALVAINVAAWLAGILGGILALVRNPAFLALAAVLGVSYDVWGMTNQEKLDVGGGINDAVNGPAGEEGWYARQRNKARGLFGLPPLDNKGNPLTGGKTAEGVNPELKARYEKMLAEAPEEIRKAIKINSGFRTPEEQKRLWDEAVQKYGSEDAARKYVAPPGRSQHNKGEALDLGFATPEASAYVHQNAGKYGLKFPMPYEPWHIERTEGRDKAKDLQDKQDALKDKQGYLMGGPQYALGGQVNRSVTIEQKTNIAINNSTDPAATSAGLEKMQPHVNAGLLRNSTNAFV